MSGLCFVHVLRLCVKDFQLHIDVMSAITSVESSILNEGFFKSSHTFLKFEVTLNKSIAFSWKKLRIVFSDNPTFSSIYVMLCYVMLCYVMLC